MGDALKTLKLRRGLIKGNVTRLKTYFNNVKSLEITPEIISQLSTRLLESEKYLSEFNNIQEQIDIKSFESEPPADTSLETYEESILNQSSQSREEFEQHLYDISAQIRVFIRENDLNINDNDSLSVHSNNSAASQQTSGVRNNIKYPTINLPSFSGQYHDWLEFHDIFQSLIHRNTSLGDVEKFYYLKSCLKADAADVIKSLEVTESNYAVAWNLLTERFQNKRLITNNHIRTLLNLNCISKESSTSLRTLSDELNKHLRCLKALGHPVDMWDTLLIQILIPKLDNVTRREWEQFEIQGDYPTTRELLTFLKKRCELLEAVNQSYTPKHYNDHQNQIVNINKRNKTLEPKRVNTYFSSTESVCVFCKGSHIIYNCGDFLKLGSQNRMSEVKKRGLCFNCLRKNHMLKDCRAITCRKCSRKHHTLLHLESVEPSRDRDHNLSSPENTENTQSYQVTCHSSFTTPHVSAQVLLATVMVSVRDERGKLHLCRAILDCGSQSNFVSEELCHRLNIRKENANLVVTGISNNLADIRYKALIEVRSNHNDFKTTVPCLVLKRITDTLPSYSFNLDNLNIPVNIQLADPNFNKSGNIDLLLGASLFWQLLCVGQISLGEGKPILQKTIFGWVVAGNCLVAGPSLKKSFVSSNASSYFCQEHSVPLENIVSKFWELEEIEHIPETSQKSSLVEAHFAQTVTRDISGRFIVQIPFKDNIDQLGTSRDLALKRLQGIERKLSKNHDLKKEYDSFLSEYENLGHMSEIIEENPISSKCCYLPHHCVQKESSTTTKVRVVFDASAKTSSGLSLNDVQMVGPVIQRDLLTLILNFRLHTYVLTADCEKMYRQVLISNEDRNYHRILWRFNPGDKLRCFTLNTVTYGTASASFLATRVLKQLAEEHQDQYPVACNIIKDSFYMDDLLTGAETLDELFQIKCDVSKVLEKGGFNLRKWQSNDPSTVFLDKNTNLTFGKDVSQSTLGIIWNPQSDVIKYTVRGFDNERPVTKRAILSIASQIFDPLGLLAPVVVVAKVIMQQLWQLKVSWDESIPMNLQTHWKHFGNHLHRLNELEIPRHAISSFNCPVELHGFADASQKAYGACIYLRSVHPDGHIFVKLLCAKSKVAPIKNTTTLPRLELCACLLLANLSYKIQSSLDLKIEKYFYYSDSTIALAWIKSEPQRWKTFVNNRVAQIQRKTDSCNWYHVRSAENPADLISRGVDPRTIIESTLWWNGPSWLLMFQSEWPTESSSDCDIEIPESRPKISLVAGLEHFDIFSRYSSYHKLSRVIAYCLRFYTNLRLKQSNQPLGEGVLTLEELQDSSRRLISLAQSQSFSLEIRALSSGEPLHRKSKLLCLNPFLDHEKLIRVGGRLGNSQFDYGKKHPVILPNHHLISKLIALDEHLKLLHCGPQQLLCSLRESYWPLSGRSLVKQIVHNCVICSKANPKTLNQIMGELPPERLNGSFPFQTTGVDYAGPFLLRDRKTRNYKLSKSYIAIFVCFLTKAMHIELVTDLTSDCFIAAFRRFVARRGKPYCIYSDNGTNFVGAKTKLDELTAFLRNIAGRNAITEFASSEGVRWCFIPPRAPHFGGLWEAAVKSVKRHLKRVIGATHLTYEDLSTILLQIEAILNSRPLHPLSSDPTDLNPITPSHFLIGRPTTALPDRPLQQVPENRLELYSRLQKLIQTFWDRWRKDYVCELQARTKWKARCPTINEGDMVLIKEDNLQPCHWKMGRIAQVFPGPDGVPRVVMIRCSSGIIKRAISKVCVLPVAGVRSN